MILPCDMDVRDVFGGPVCPRKLHAVYALGDHRKRGIHDFRTNSVARVKCGSIGAQANHSAFPTSCGSLVGPKPTFDSELYCNSFPENFKLTVTVNGVS